MRVVIEEITGEDLVLLMYILKRLDFGNKEQLMKLRQEWLNEKHGER